MNAPAALIEVEVETSSPPRRKRKAQLTPRVPSKRRRTEASAKTGISRSRTSLSKGERSATKQAKGVEEGTVRVKESTRKRRMITKLKLHEICKELRSVAGCSLLSQVIKKVEADSVHLSAFPARASMWKYMQDSPALLLMIDHLKENFISLYEANFRGKDKYARFLVAWHENLSHIAVAGCKTVDDIWFKLLDGCEHKGEASDRSTILTAVAKGVYEIMNEKVTKPVTRVASYPQGKGSAPDDDASIIWVCGFALHSTISLRKKALLINQHRKHKQVTRQHYKNEMKLLRKLKADDKSFLPPLIKYQDRGKMTIMHPSMLPFGRKVFTVIRSSLNYDKYVEHGSEIFSIARKNVLLDTEIASTFKCCVQSLYDEQVDIEDSVVIKVCKVLLSKILNTVSNDFLTNITQLDKIENNKGTGANIQLRDKLKAAAADTHSRVPKI